MFSQPISCPVTQMLKTIGMKLCFMLSQCISWPGYLSTNDTGVGDSSDVVSFYVVWYIPQCILLATHFTYSLSFVALTTTNNISEMSAGSSWESRSQWSPSIFESRSQSRKMGLAFWKSRSQSRKRDWHFESLDPSLEKGIKVLKVSIPVSKKGSQI